MDINITDFRANLLKYLKMTQSGQEISITSNGKILANITPPTKQKNDAIDKLNELAKTAQIGDITSPIDMKWDAAQ